MRNELTEFLNLYCSQLDEDIYESYLQNIIDGEFEEVCELADDLTNFEGVNLDIID